MAFVIKHEEHSYLCCFQFVEAGREEWRFFATDFNRTYTETVSFDVLMERNENLNETLRIKTHRLIGLLEKSIPASCSIVHSPAFDSATFQLIFTFNSRELRVYFETRECSPSEAGSFSAGLMKLAIENTLLIDQMKKSLEAKDLEIEEYKANGGTLIRETLATKKFDFEQERQLSTLKLKPGTLPFNPSPALTTLNIPELCSMINAENVLEEIQTKYKTESSQRVKVTKTKTRQPAMQRAIDRKFEYVSDDEDDDPAEGESSPKKKSTQTSACQKKSKVAKKTLEL